MNIGEFFGGKEAELKTLETLDPQQRALFDKFGSYLTSSVGEGATPWTGAFGVDPSKYEEMGLGQLGKYVGGEPSELQKFGVGQFTEALKGLSPEYMEDIYRTSYLPRQERLFKEETIPAIRESFIGPGTFYSGGGAYGGRTGAEAKAAETFGEFTAGQLADLIFKGQEYGRESLDMLPGMVSMVEEDPLRRATAGLTLGSLPRVLEQQELQARMNEFMRTQPEYSPMLQYLQPYLGTQTMASYMQPGYESPFLSLLGTGLKAAGTYAGMKGGEG